MATAPAGKLSASAAKNRLRGLIWMLIVCIGLWLAALQCLGAPNPPNLPTNLPNQRRPLGIRTNLPPVSLRPNPRTNQLALVPRPATGSKTNAAPATAKAAPPTRIAGFKEKLRHAAASPYFYPAIAVSFLCLGIGAVLLSKKSKTQPKVADGAEVAGDALTVAARMSKRRTRKVAIQTCNVLELGGTERKLWQFDARGGAFVLGRENAGRVGERLPGQAAKDWTTLWRHKLNVAWLPAEDVFLRAAQFPQSEFQETVSMVELQLEKLSPMPVAQIVWNIQVVPHASGDMQTVIVIIVARSIVEEFLGQLEGQGYLADRLELPLLDQLEATAISGDGAWIYPEAAGGKNAALVAWWYGGALQNLTLVHLPPAEPAAGLREQMLQMTWAGEMEGWLASPPRWHLVADTVIATAWQPALQEALEQEVELIAPLPAPKLAALTATRAAHAEPLANLLPIEFASRYRDQFIDRLWMRGLGAVVGIYLLGILFYFVRLEVATYFVHGVEQQVAALGPSYTNAMQLKARFTVLQDRQDLKYAALDCLKKVAELMPEVLTLDGYGLSDGKKLGLNGTAPADQVGQINEFESRMRKATDLDGQPMFDPNGGEHFTWHVNPDRSTVNWNFSLELKRTDIQ